MNDQIKDLFHKISAFTSQAIGSPPAFIIALLLIIGWIVTGPFFHYSDTWQLVINTTTTIVTFLIVFLIQHTQNRDSHALHLKLDELIRANSRAHNTMIGIEYLTETEVRQLQRQIQDQIDKQKITRQNKKKEEKL